MGAQCSSRPDPTRIQPAQDGARAVVAVEEPATTASPSRAGSRPDPHLVIRTLTGARMAGVSAEATRAFLQRGTPMPLGTGAAAEAEWSAWSAELARASAAAAVSLPPIAAAAASAAEALPPPPSKFAALRPDGGGGGCRIPETALRAITLPQLKRVLALAKELCAADKWTDARTGEPLAAAELNLYHVNARVITPATKEACCSLVELLADSAQPPDVFVSHWWGEPVQDFIACLEQLCEDVELDKETTRFWVCAYALNQHDVAGELASGLASGPFVRALLLADCAVSLIDARGVYFTRAWCAYELYKALVDCLPGFKHHIVTATPSLKDGFDRSVPAVCLLDGFAKSDSRYSGIKATREAAFPQSVLELSQAFSLATAEASEASDLHAINTEVGGDTKALEATLRVRFATRTLSDAATEDEQLAPLLRDLTIAQLRSLSLSFGGKQTEARALQLGKALPECLVDVRFEKGHPALAAGVAESALGQCGRLLILKLVRCNTDNARLWPLFNALAHSGRELQTLDLSYNQLGAEGGKALAQALQHMLQLQTLELGYNELGAEGGTALAQALQHVPQLQKLNLKGNALGPEGGKAVAQALQHMPQLQELGLGSNKLGAEGGTAVAQALQHVPQLQTLDLGCNNLDAEGGKAVAQALQHVPQLHTLELREAFRRNELDEEVQQLLRTEWAQKEGRTKGPLKGLYLVQ